MAQQLLYLLLRAAAIFFGGTITGHFLVTRGPAADRANDGIDAYLPWLLDAIVPDGPTLRAAGHTVALTTIGAATAVALAAGLGSMARDPLYRRSGRRLLVPAAAMSGPPFVALGVAVARRVDGGAFAGPADLGNEAFASGRLLLYGGLVLGAAMAPSAWAVLGGHRSRAFGLGALEATLASRPAPSARWRLGVPTTTFLFSLTAVELIGTRSGLLHRFAMALGRVDASVALDSLAMVVAAGAVLAVVFDALTDPSRQEPPPPPLPPAATKPDTELSPWFVPFAAGAVIATTFALWGRTTASTPSSEDLVGVELLRATAAGIAPAVLGGLIPAAMALGLGWLLATIRRRLDPVGARIVGAFIDVLWWPLPMVMALAHRFVASPSDPSVDPGTIALTGLALSPLAARLTGREMERGDGEMTARLLSAWLYCTAAGVGLVLTLGVMGAAGDEPTLGRLIAVAARGDGFLASVVPPLVGFTLLTLINGLGAGVSSPPSIPSRGVIDRNAEAERLVPNRPSSSAAQRKAKRVGAPPPVRRRRVDPDDNQFLVIATSVDESDADGTDSDAAGPEDHGDTERAERAIVTTRPAIEDDETIPPRPRTRDPKTTAHASEPVDAIEPSPALQSVTSLFRDRRPATPTNGNGRLTSSNGNSPTSDDTSDPGIEKTVGPPGD